MIVDNVLITPAAVATTQMPSLPSQDTPFLAPDVCSEMNYGRPGGQGGSDIHRLYLTDAEKCFPEGYTNVISMLDFASDRAPGWENVPSEFFSSFIFLFFFYVQI